MDIQWSGVCKEVQNMSHGQREDVKRRKDEFYKHSSPQGFDALMDALQNGLSPELDSEVLAMERVVRKLQKLMEQQNQISLNRVSMEGGTPLEDRIPDADSGLDRIELESHIKELPALVTEELKVFLPRPTPLGMRTIHQVLQELLKGETSQAEIARELGLTRERVRQIIVILNELPSMKRLRGLLKEFISGPNEEHFI